MKSSFFRFDPFEDLYTEKYEITIPLSIETVSFLA